MKTDNPPSGDTFIAYIDGACRGNPGPAGCAAVLMCGNTVMLEAKKYLGKSTNNRAEYSGLILALTRAAEFKSCRRIIVRTDSQLIARQITGKYKINDAELKRLNLVAKELISGFDSFKIQEIPRAQNNIADGLANQAIDEGRDIKS